VTSLPEALVQFRMDLEEAIGREQAARLRKQHRRRIATLVAAAVVVIVGTASAFAAVREFFREPYPSGRVTRTVDGIRFSFRVPGNVGDARWENGPIERTGDTADRWASPNFLINRSTVGGQAGEAVVFWTVFPDGGQAAPCTKLLSTAGRSTADLAAAVARAPGTQIVKGPRRATLGGRQAQHVVVIIRRDLGCDPGYFFTWRDQWWGAFWPGTYAGDVISMWIVGVDGTRLVIEAETKRPRSQYPPAAGGPRVTRADVLKVEREIARIVESIRFD
jgi:hypothetical protein